jgi:murein DD-endopeptidase MepM/ murein hydrolase activator NlpD
MPYFMGRDPSLKGEPVDVFVRVNRDLRKSNGKKVWEICQKSDPEPLWSGAFLRMTNAKRMAGFADHRTYVHNGKEIDQQVHMGVDLASLVMSPVEASNRGNVVYADELGIYGNTVILDHGCGLFSMYSHLSRIDVKQGQVLEKGEPLGLTGATGLAGGDHLHFGMLIHGVYVTPIEWWDPHWVHDNVEIKLALLQSGGG